MNSQIAFNFVTEYLARQKESSTPEQFEILRKLQVSHDSEDLSKNAKNKLSSGFECIAKEFGLDFDRVAFENKLSDPNYK